MKVETRIGCGCLIAGGTVVGAVEPMVTAVGSDLFAMAIKERHPFLSLRLPVNSKELAVSLITDAIRYYLALNVYGSTGDPSLAAVTFLGIGFAHNMLVIRRVAQFLNQSYTT